MIQRYTCEVGWMVATLYNDHVSTAELIKRREKQVKLFDAVWVEDVEENSPWERWKANKATN